MGVDKGSGAALLEKGGREVAWEVVMALGLKGLGLDVVGSQGAAEGARCAWY